MECPECGKVMFISEKGYKCECGHREAISRSVGRPTTPTYNFRKFIPTRVGIPFVSIRRNGMFWFNQAAQAEYDLDDYGFVILHYDEINKAIGFLLTNDKDAEGSLNMLKEKNRGRLVCCRAFFNYYKIRIEKGRKITKIEREGDMLIVRIQ